MVKRTSYKIVWDTHAVNQFKEILSYLFDHSVYAPAIVKKEVFRSISRISKNPHLFEADKLKDPQDAAFRAFIVFSYRVSYQIVAESKEIRILRIRHTSQEPLGY